MYVAEVNGNKINLSLNDPMSTESDAEDVGSAQVDRQWNDMMVALKEAGPKCKCPVRWESAEPEPAVGKGVGCAPRRAARIWERVARARKCAKRADNLSYVY